MSTKGRRRPPRPRIEVVPAAATAEETAAIAAALERFLREIAPTPATAQVSRWQRAALIEGVGAKRAAFPAEPGSGFPLG